MNSHLSCRRYVLGLTVLLSMSCWLHLRPLHAADPGPSDPLPASVQDSQRESRQFDIPAQSLMGALAAFAEQSGWQVFYSSDLAEGRSTEGVRGPHQPEQALQFLLVGTGVTYRITGASSVTIERPATQSIPVIPMAPGNPDPSPAQSKSLQSAPNTTKAIKVPEILVKDVRERETAELDNLPPEYAGGQVASGGRVGILGNKSIMDTPFTQMNYTSKLIQDQQAPFFSDVLRNDPSVQFNQPTAGGIMDTLAIRGLIVNPIDMLFNGFMSIAPTFNGMMMTESIERIEVLRGPSALLNGPGTSGNIGGTINLVPKRAGDEALTQLTTQYISDSQIGGHVDVGRRFGAHKQFGIRINGAYRNGDLPIDHSSRESALATLGLDYRGDIVRLSADFGYQEQEVRGGRRQFFVASGVTALPEPPDTRINANQPWEVNRSRALYGTLRSEIDVTKHITAFGGVGLNRDRRQTMGGTRQITDSIGTLAAGVASPIGSWDAHTLTMDAGVRSSFHTGPIHHQAVAAYTWYSLNFQTARATPYDLPASNIYNPIFTPAPPLGLLPRYSDVKNWIQTEFSSAVLGDTLSIFDQRVQLTAGVRLQQIKNSSFERNTGILLAEYEKSAATPMVGLVVKPWQHVSLYANYIQALQQGPVAPVTAVNAGEVFTPFVSKGYETGVKVDFGRITTTLAAYQINQPNAFINPVTNVFGVDGEQRHRGVEFSVFGEVTEGVRLLAGTSYIDAELTKTQGGVNQGNKTPVLPFQFTLYGEWDVPFLKAVTLTSRVTHGASQFINLANTQKIREWTQWDFGARYRFERANGKPITLRANLENVLDTKAWYGSSLGSSVFVRDPRTFLLSATFDF